MGRIKNFVYSDIDRYHKVNEFTGDIRILYDEDAILQSLRHLVMGEANPRFFQPHFKSNIARLLFDPLDEITIDGIKDEIKRIIKMHEPRVKLTWIEGKAVDEQKLKISVGYTIKPYSQEQVFETILERVR